ncbi:hypothetical protein AMECASPLE_039767 [Ameca splendens]|uniref:Uncharacterized protein n=1 Tax=Ameca splendens TaxID=208324 RepID=A0ABV1AEX7_9TELE
MSSSEEVLQGLRSNTELMNQALVLDLHQTVLVPEDSNNHEGELDGNPGDVLVLITVKPVCWINSDLRGGAASSGSSWCCSEVHLESKLLLKSPELIKSGFIEGGTFQMIYLL